MMGSSLEVEEVGERGMKQMGQSPSMGLRLVWAVWEAEEEDVRPVGKGGALAKISRSSWVVSVEAR